MTEIVGRQFPAKIFSDIKAVVKRFSDLIGKLSRATARKSKDKREYDELQAGRYPPGVRPYSAPMEAGYDDPFSASSGSDYMFMAEIPRGATRKEASQIVHRAAAAFHKAVDLEVVTEYVDILQKQTSYDAFIAEAMAPATRHHTSIQSLGIQLPPGIEAPTALSKEKALELYMAMVNKLAIDKARQEEQEQKEKKAKDKLREAVRNTNPKDLFDRAVRQAMSETRPKDVDHRVDYVQALVDQTTADEYINFDKPAPSTRKNNIAGNNTKPEQPAKQQKPSRRFTKQELAQRKVRTNPNGPTQSASPGETKAAKGKGKNPTAQPPPRAAQKPGGHSGTQKGGNSGKGKGTGNGKNAKGFSKGKGKNLGKTK